MENPEGRHLRIFTQNAAVLSLANLSSRLLMIVLGICIARRVGETDYGQFSQAIAWTLVLAVVGNLGLERLVTRETARAPAEASPLIRQALVLKLGACALSVPVVMILNALLSSGGQMTLLLYLMGIYNVLDSFRLLFCAVFEGFVRMELELWLTSAQSAGVFVLALIALLGGGGVVGVAWAHIVAGILSVALGYYMLVRLAPPAGKLYQRNIWRLMGDVLPFTLYTLFVMLYYRFPVGLIGLWQGDAAAGWFNAAYIIAVNLMILPRIILNSSFPLLAQGQVVDRSSVRSLGGQTIRYLVLLGFPLALGFGLAAPAIIQLLYGPAYAPAAWVLQVVSLSIPFSFLNTFLEGVLGAVDRQGQCTLIRGTMLALFLGSSWLLVRRIGYGGMALAFVVVEAAACLTLCLVLAGDIRWQALGPTLWKSALAGAVMAGGLWAGRSAFVLIDLALGGGVYILALAALRAFNAEDISVARSLGRRALGWALREH